LDADSTAASDTPAAAAIGGVSLTTALLKAISSQYGFSLSPGAGGSTGGIGVAISGYTSGTFSATSGNAGRGAASVLVVSGGAFSCTGTVNLSGANASSSSVAKGVATRCAVAAGGSSGGAAGSFLALCYSTITNSATYTLTAGTSASGATDLTGAGGKPAATAGGASADGLSVVIPTF
jgi:hypothetical protein